MIDAVSQSSELYRQARDLMEKNQLEDAVSLFQQSIALSPHFKALELLGECCIRLNRLREAIVPLAAATTLNQGVRAPSLLADVFLKLEDYYRANEVAGIALSRDPNNRMALNAQKVAGSIVGDALTTAHPTANSAWFSSLACRLSRLAAAGDAGRSLAVWQIQHQ